MEEKKYPYRRFPQIPVSGLDEAAASGVETIRARIAEVCAGRGKVVLMAECYPGVDQAELLAILAPIGFAAVIHSDDYALPPEEIDRMVERELTDDPVFGIMTTYGLSDFSRQKRQRRCGAR